MKNGDRSKGETEAGLHLILEAANRSEGGRGPPRRKKKRKGEGGSLSD